MLRAHARTGTRSRSAAFTAGFRRSRVLPFDRRGSGGESEDEVRSVEVYEHRASQVAQQALTARPIVRGSERVEFLRGVHERSDRRHAGLRPSLPAC